MVNDTAHGFYEECGRLEWGRPPESAYSQVEHSIIMHYLDKYLPPRGLVLDAGGGNGRYTIELAKRGYQVVLLDRSAAQLTIAREEVAKLPRGVRENVLDIVQGSIEDLSEFESGHFDAVVCIRGALSRLIERDAREKAAEELFRGLLEPSYPLWIRTVAYQELGGLLIDEGSLHEIGLIGNVVGAIKVGIVGHRRSVEKVDLVKAITALLK